MIDTSFIKPTDQNSIKQINSYTKSHKEYYDIKPKKKGTDLVFTKEQEKLQFKILKSSLKYIILKKDNFIHLFKEKYGFVFIA